MSRSASPDIAFDTRRGILVVLNERPPLESGIILEALETEMLDQDRATHFMDYEDIVLMAFTLEPNDPLAFQSRLFRLEEMFFSDLQKRLLDGVMVLLSGWLRNGPGGERLLESYLDIARDTNCVVVWINSTSYDPEMHNCEYLTALVEDMKWADGGVDEVDLDLIHPQEQPVGTLDGVRLKYFERALDEGLTAAVDELLPLIAYWDDDQR